MGSSDGLDPLVFGHRLRHLRRQSGMTLAVLGHAVGRPPSYLSQLENGHLEPRLSTVNRLAAALGCHPGDLLVPGAPTRRAELEVELAHMQDDPTYKALQLPYLRPSARLDTAALEHVVALFTKVKELSSPGPNPASAAPETWLAGARAANISIRAEMRKQDNYFEHIEQVASRALAAVGYRGPGAVSERNLTDVARYFGFKVARVQDLPPSTRSISDTRHKVIYVPQRNTAGGMRQSRSVIAKTLGHVALGHDEPTDVEGHVRQRVEGNYFAGALLAPEGAFVHVLGDAKAREDISVEDLREVFYLSYEMAAHRVTNLVTRHFGIRAHFQRCDPEGVLWQAYENDGVLLPSDRFGTVEGQRLCRRWSSRRAFEAEDSYALYYQYTETVAGTFWCATHVDLERNDGDAVTVGTRQADAHWFRGSETAQRAVSTCPDPSCCRRPPPDTASRWGSAAWPLAHDRSRFLRGQSPGTVVLGAELGVEFTDVYSFLDRHCAGVADP
ncbi:MAG: helix-turn-helix domain-containing protein [Acidimicrobiales bacterium]